MRVKLISNSWIFACFVQLYIVVEYSGAVPRSMGYPGGACTRPRLKNGIAQSRLQGRQVRFKCADGFRILGAKSATCVASQWDVLGLYPVCVKSGCYSPVAPKSGGKNSLLGGAVIKFYCNSGYKLAGSEYIFCDGYRWNATRPTCKPEHAEPPTTCDFETEALCGWQQELNDHFDWQRHEGATPSASVGTGPAFDHTLGAGQHGHYMFIESSSPRSQGDTAKLLSPVYAPDKSVDACFIIWYHMYGVSIGSLKIYTKTSEDRTWNQPKPILTVSGQQGNVWVRRMVKLKPTAYHFQIVVEAVTGDGYVGDAAIDDVTLANGTDCIEPITEPPPAVSPGGDNGDLGTSLQSCRGRCTASTTPAADADMSSSSPEPGQEGDTIIPDSPVIVACECSESCLTNDANCCQDFTTYCIAVKTTPAPTTSSFDNQAVTTGLPYHPPPPLPPLPPNPNTLTSPESQPSPSPPDYSTSAIYTTVQPTTVDQEETTQPPTTRTLATSPETAATTRVPTTTPSTTRLVTTNTPETRATKGLTSTTITTQTTQSTTTPPQTDPATTTKIVTLMTKPPTTKLATLQTTAKTTTSTTRIPTAIRRIPTSTRRVPTTTTTRAPTTVKRIQPTTTVTTSTRRPTTTKLPKTLKPVVNRKPNEIDKEDGKGETKKPTADQPKGEARQAPVTASWSTSPALAGIIAGLLLLLLGAAATAFVIVRRRRRSASSRRGHHMADDSDVRFLTAEEVLDFNMARPREDEDGL